VGIEFGVRLFPLEDGELVAKSNSFQRKSVAWQEEGTQVSMQRTDQGQHDPILN
jgi:hypothetical protein